MGKTNVMNLLRTHNDKVVQLQDLCTQLPSVFKSVLRFPSSFFPIRIHESGFVNSDSDPT